LLEVRHCFQIPISLVSCFYCDPGVWKGQTTTEWPITTIGSQEPAKCQSVGVKILLTATRSVSLSHGWLHCCPSRRYFTSPNLKDHEEKLISASIAQFIEHSSKLQHLKSQATSLVHSQHRQAPLVSPGEITGPSQSWLIYLLRLHRRLSLFPEVSALLKWTLRRKNQRRSDSLRQMLLRALQREQIMNDSTASPATTLDSSAL
jgi:hypothetical protein